MSTSDTVTWPGGARCAVLLSFDVDGPAVWIDDDADAWSRPRTFSLGAYGPHRGLARILDILDDAGIAGTFFVPGWICEHWSSQIREVVAAHHELGHHGYLHELYMGKTLPEMAAIIERSQKAFEKVGSVPAVGFRGPSGDFPEGSHALLRELGFSYSSSMRGDDRPYRWEIDGERSDLIEIPAHWELDDFPAFGYNDSPIVPDGGDRISSLADVLDNWVREFDGYHREGLCYTLMMHPQLIGRPGRAEVLRDLIAHMKSRGDVWFATGKEIATWWRESKQ